MKNNICFRDRLFIIMLAVLSILLIACGGGKNTATPSENTFTISPSPDYVSPSTSLNAMPGSSALVTVSFDYEKQSGYSSNQFAVWVQDGQGQHVKTLFATNFTASGGWEKREQSIPDWVKSFDIANAELAAIDSVSGATPAAGNQQYAWDCTDASGNPVADGVYTIIVEATLREENRVLYKAEIDTTGQKQSISPEPEYFGDSHDERDMITNVLVEYSI